MKNLQILLVATMVISEYNTDGAETVFVSLGSSAENVEAASDYIAEKHGEKVGCYSCKRPASIS